MTQPNPSTAMARVIIDELRRHGVDFAVISPGSRSGALALAADSRDGVSTHVVLDERSAAFMALGRSKATGVPSLVISTSGTAVANHFPAVVEADMSMTPLMVMSADRPAEMRGVGANQTIDQVGIFGSKVRFSATLEAPADGFDGNDEWRSIVSTAVAAAKGSTGMPGPVHLNVAFREPTVPVPDDGRSSSARYPFSIEGREDGGPWLSWDEVAERFDDADVPRSHRGLVVAGDGTYDRPALMAAAARLGWPVLSTALSGLRGTKATITAYQHALSRGIPTGLIPDVVVAVGSVGPSQRLEDLVAAAGCRLRVDASGRHIDPRRNATAVLQTDPVSFLAGLEAPDPDPGWLRRWDRVEHAVRRATDDALSGIDEPTGPGIAATLGGCEWETMVVASSLPVRDVDSTLSRPGRVIANRGASGIDGLVSTALGVASVGQSTLAFCGDLSLFHDSNGFFCAGEQDLVLVVADNRGGGLFDLLPQATHAPGFERLFIAPPNRDIGALARLHRVSFLETGSVSALAGLVATSQAKGGVTLIRLPVDRHTDLATRAELDQVGAEAARSVEP